MANGITDVQGIEVGHYTDKPGATGCTVVVCPDGAVAGVDVRGGAPGTSMTDLLGPGNPVVPVHAVVLSGGSAFGISASAGAIKYLEEQGIGYKRGPIIVPLVPSAILFDLGLVSQQARPGPEEGYAACLARSSGGIEEGTVGAGTGATVGKALGMKRAVKGGIGTCAIQLPDGTTIGAIIAVNAYGSVVDHRTGQVIAGPRSTDGTSCLDSSDLLIRDGDSQENPQPVNTTIGVVATDAPLSKDQVHYLARVSHDGLALTVRPCHTLLDGDTIFALATREERAESKTISSRELTKLGAAAVEVVARSVLRAVTQAEGLGGVPAVSELG